MRQQCLVLPWRRRLGADSTCKYYVEDSVLGHNFHLCSCSRSTLRNVLCPTHFSCLCTPCNLAYIVMTIRKTPHLDLFILHFRYLLLPRFIHFEHPCQPRSAAQTGLRNLASICTVQYQSQYSLLKWLFENLYKSSSTSDSGIPP